MDQPTIIALAISIVGVTATLAGGMVWVVKALLRKSDVRDGQIERALNQNNEVIRALQAAVKGMKSFEQEEEAMHAAIIGDLKSIVSTQERILEIQERILKEMREANGKTTP